MATDAPAEVGPIGDPGFLGRAEFALAPELEELQAAADRLGRERLADRVRDAEAAGQLADDVVAVLDGFPVTGLDLAERLGGAGAGVLAKTVVLEALAYHDAGGLPAADRLGGAAGALEHCPDRTLAGDIAAACLAGDARIGLTVPDETTGGRLAWIPAWPQPRWVATSAGDTLTLHELADGVEVELVQVLAFQASGGVSVDLAAAAEVGQWELGPGEGEVVRGRARVDGAATAVGIAAAALEDTIGYTTERIVFGKPVAHHQGNAFDLAVAGSRVHGARLMVRYAASLLDSAAAGNAGPDAAKEAGFWATQAWLETMEAAFTVTDTGVQLHGGHGFLVDHLAEKRFREARHLALQIGARDSAEQDVAASVLEVGDLLDRPATDGIIDREVAR